MQNGTTHCCTLSTRTALIPWLQSIVAISAATPPGLTPTFGTFGTFACVPDGTVDGQGEIDCAIATPLLKSVSAATAGTQAGWFPDTITANAWLTWVTSPTTN